MIKKLITVVTMMCALCFAQLEPVNTENQLSTVQDVSSSSEIVESSSATVVVDSNAYIGKTFALTATSLIMSPEDNIVAQYRIKNPDDSIKLATVIRILNNAKTNDNATWGSINEEIPLCSDTLCNDVVKIVLDADSSINVTARINDSTYTLAGYAVIYEIDPMMTLICAVIVAVLGLFGIKVKLNPEGTRKVIDTTK